ncbi:hypothetical protein V865_004782 [Kwoniella europaea PYCC6329]|uniref:Uncharacterized protein n=1 Tax=Kwoniella europaea PYCC6329 TaxID=1423913 RepID=A0AAX4KKM6_9TREE
MSSTFSSRFSSFARSSSFSSNLGRSKSWTSGGQSTSGTARTGSNNSYFHHRSKAKKDVDKKTLDTLYYLKSVGDEYESALSIENHGRWGFLSSNKTDQSPRVVCPGLIRSNSSISQSSVSSCGLESNISEKWIYKSMRRRSSNRWNFEPRLVLIGEGSVDIDIDQSSMWDHREEVEEDYGSERESELPVEQ